MVLPMRGGIHTLRRAFSASAIHRWGDVPEWASEEARTALQGFQARFAEREASKEPVTRYTQALDGNQIHLLRTMQASMLPLEGGGAREEDTFTGRLAERSGVLQHGAPIGSSLVPTEHLAFFTPRVSSASLGADGSDTSFNPPGGVFTRRMWAGGQMSWPGLHASTADVRPAVPLRVGDRIWEKTFVEDAQLKRLAGGRGEMIVVWVRKEFGREGSVEPSIVDRRSWVFQTALKGGGQSSKLSSPSTAQISDPAAAAPPARLLNPSMIVQTPANLFRYSALTFNAHAIHLSTAWARDMEGHRDIVVHGPLNLSLLVRKWGRELAGWRFNEGGRFDAGSHRELINVSYRAKKPVYAGQTYWIGLLNEGNDKDSHRVVAMHTDGQVAMEATIESRT